MDSPTTGIIQAVTIAPLATGSAVPLLATQTSGRAGFRVKNIGPVAVFAMEMNATDEPDSADIVTNGDSIAVGESVYFWCSDDCSVFTGTAAVTGSLYVQELATGGI